MGLGVLKEKKRGRGDEQVETGEGGRISERGGRGVSTMYVSYSAHNS